MTIPRGGKFSRVELNSFLDIIKEVLPLLSTLWESMVRTHLARYPEKGHTVDSLKRKFKELYGKQIPTRDPHCPPAICCAKQLRYAIIKLMDGSHLISANGMGYSTWRDKSGEYSGNSDNNNDDLNQDPGVEDEPDSGLDAPTEGQAGG